MSEMETIRYIKNLPSEVQARLLERLKQKETAQTVIRPRSQDSQPILSFAQRRLWFMEQLLAGSPSYNVPLAVQLEGALQIAVFARSISEVVRRHETLRTTFVADQGQPLQIIAPELHLSVPLVDMQTLEEPYQQREIQRLITEEATSPFDLVQGPLLRVTLLRQADSQHVLLITMHHIISDGWSIEVLIQELTTVYAAFLQERLSPLPGLPVQYADYALWQRQWLQGGILEQQLAYWREQLQNVPIVQVPTDHSRPQGQRFQGAQMSFQLSSQLSAGIQQLSRQAGATLYMTLLTAFNVLLWRYSGQDDLVVGMPIANRTHKELEPLIGFFVNTLVLRTQLAGDMSVRAFMQRVQKQVLDAQANQDLPFEYLVEQLQPERDPSRNPFFQIVCTMLNAPAARVDSAGLTMTPLRAATATAKFDLSLLLTETPAGFTGNWEYTTDLFTAESIRRMHRHWQCILEAMVADPEQSLAQLPLLQAAEEQHMLLDWNATQKDFAFPHCLPLLVEQQVERTPDAVAVIFEEQILTYRALDQRANALAHVLRRHGVESEHLVGICLSRSLEMLIALLAILKAGGAYVPLDPTNPPERLRLMIQDAGLSLMLTQPQWRQSLEPLVDTLLVIDLSEEEPSGPEAAAPPARYFHPEQLAYVIYTSGSTGKPKGVMTSQRGICNRLFWAQQTYQMRPEESILHKSPLTFDISIEELFWPLMVGAHTVIARPEGHRDSEYIVQTIVREQISILRLVTPMLAVLVETAGLEACRTLRLLICGGETLVREVVQRFYTRLPRTQVVLHNFYGATEASVDSTFWVCEPEDERGVVPVGCPMSNVAIYVLDGRMKPVPVGVVGDIYIGGISLARGYLGQSRLTAERFVPDPHGQSAGGRLYQTGDQGRYLSDGVLEFVGRKDTQVKLRGYRIELGEIEAALSAAPGIKDAVVVVREDIPGNQRLVAYLVREPGSVGSTSALRATLRERLPEYMVPGSLVELESLPLTSNGKVDRQSLPPLRFSALEQEEAYIAPRTPVEQLLGEIWASVLGTDRIGVHDDFFALGGHSLLATQVVSRVQETFQRKLPLQTFFARPTLAGLAEEVQNALREREESLRPPLQPRLPGMDLPLSPAQQGLWLQEKLAPGNPFYIVPLAIRLEGLLNFPALSRSVNELISRHEILRTRFVESAGRPVQVIREQLELVIPLVNLQGCAAESQQQEIQKLISAEANQLFNLSAGPLLRATVLRVDSRQHIFLLSIHHIVTDGWSMSVLAQELTTLYAASAAGQASTLARLPVQYADFVLWQQAWLQGPVLKQQASYWREQLAGLVPLQLPTDYPRPARSAFHGAQLPFQFSPQLSRSLLHMSRQAGVTLFMTLLAAFQLVLSRYSGQEDIAVGTAIANRQQSELEALIGCFVNVLLLRTRINHRQTVRELLQQVREVCLGAYMHQDLPFRDLMELLQPERDLGHNALLRAIFALHNTPARTTAVDDLTLVPLRMGTGAILFDLGLSLVETPEGLQGVWEYRSELFEAATIKRMQSYFQLLLEAMVESQERPLIDLPALPHDEWHALLHKWRVTAPNEAATLSFAHLFERQVQATPDTIALLWEERQMTYQVLNERANQLAHFLQKCGVGPEVMVGLCIERSSSALIAILGILKAGGAYLPLDPEYPQDRLNFLLQDSQVSILLTQQNMREKLLAYPGKLICLDTEWVTLAQESLATPVSNVHITNLAYMIYTSGSTGKPKGVQVTHQGITNLSSFLKHNFPIDARNRVLQFASLSFDSSVFEICQALLAGATLCLARRELLLPGPELVQLWREQAITHVTLPSSVLRVLPVGELPDLETLIVAGEANSLATLVAWSEGRSVCNGYGLTETTICASITRYQAGSPKVTIDQPMENVEFYLVDPSLRPVPMGVPGELLIGGANLARGYFNRPDLTAERFLPHPFSTEAGARLYKTGDVARFLSDGSLEYLGRNDHQVKLRGFRIELGEIEAVLGQHPAVQACVVTLYEDAAGTKRLAGYVVPREPHELTVSTLRHYLGAQLPQYMIPSRWLFLDALPLSISNKVDLQALPAPDDEQAPSLSSLATSHTSTESILVTIWQRLLGSEVGINDNFFALGGDSILCLQMVTLAAQVGLTITPSDLFQHQTIAELAEVIAFTGEQQQDQESVSGPVPLLPIQHWFFEQELRMPQHFVLTFFLQAQRRLEPALLARALDALLRHHDALRLSFTYEEPDWQQSHQNMKGSQTFSAIDLSSLHAAEQQAALEQLITRFQTSLDLQNGPLLHVSLLDSGPQEPQRVCCFVHHLLIDVVSQRILVEDLQAAYQQLAQGEEVHLPAKTASYQRWSQFLTEYAFSERIAQEIPYWHHQPYTAITPLPVENVQEATGSEEDRRLFNVLDESVTQKLLHSLPQTHNLQINEVLLTALSLTLARWTGQYTTLIDLEGHGREDLAGDIVVSRTIGWFTSLFPLFLELKASMTAGDALLAVKEQVRSMPHHGIGYGVLRYLRHDPLLQAFPRAEVNFNYLGQFQQIFTPSSLFTSALGPLDGLDNPPEAPAYRLGITAQVRQNQLHLCWRYKDQHYHQATIEKLAEDFLDIVRDLVQYCQTSEMSIYTPSDFPDIAVSQQELDGLLALLDLAQGASNE